MAAYIEEHDYGITWVIDEPMARASHALVDDGRVWIIDPVDDKEAMEKVVALGKPVAVFQLLDRHNRDCEAIAKRLDVPHVTQPDELHGTPFESFNIIQNRFWSEKGLWWQKKHAGSSRAPCGAPASGTAWVPAAESNTTYSAGDGLSLTGKGTGRRKMRCQAL